MRNGCLNALSPPCGLFVANPPPLLVLCPPPCLVAARRLYAQVLQFYLHSARGQWLCTGIGSQCRRS